MHQENLNSYEYLVKKHQGLVYHIVNKFHVSSFDRDDLIQAGMLGLLEAIKKYDISFNTKFAISFFSFDNRAYINIPDKLHILISNKIYNLQK